jgi:hypothetical protein
MKICKLSILYFALAHIGISVHAQGSLQNLGFESGLLVPVPAQPDFYYFDQAFPGWTGYEGGIQEGLTWYNQLPMSIVGFSIIDSAYQTRSIYGMPTGLIEGSQSAVLISGTGLGPEDARLAQTGLVPAGTESLLFMAQYAPFVRSSGSFDVTLGGQTLSLVPLGSGANYTLYGADVHDLAGQVAELDFTVHSYPGQLVADYLFLDSIQFSPQVIPEPAVLGLFTLGALLLGWRGLGRQR